MSVVTTSELENNIRNIVAEILEIKPEKVGLDSKFVDELGMDSMMALEILASIEKKYKIKIPEENLVKVTSLRNLLDIVQLLIK